MLTDAQKIAICLQYNGDHCGADLDECNDAVFHCCFLCPHARFEDDTPGCYIEDDNISAQCPNMVTCELYLYMKDILWRTMTDEDAIVIANALKGDIIYVTGSGNSDMFFISISRDNYKRGDLIRTMTNDKVFKVTGVVEPFDDNKPTIYKIFFEPIWRLLYGNNTDKLLFSSPHSRA